MKTKEVTFSQEMFPVTAGISKLPMPYEVESTRNWVIRLSAATVLVAGGFYIAPILTAGMWTLSKMFASGTAMIGSAIVLGTVIKLAPAIWKYIEDGIDGVAYKLTYARIVETPMLYIQRSLDDAIRGRDTIAHHFDAVTGVLDTNKAKIDELGASIASFEAAAIDLVDNVEKQGEFDRLAQRIQQDRAYQNELQNEVDFMEDMQKQLRDLYELYVSEVDGLQHKMELMDDRWNNNNHSNAILTAAERVLMDAAVNENRKNAKAAAKVILEGRAAAFSRLNRLSQYSSAAISAHKAGNSKVADELRAKIQQEKTQLPKAA